MKIVEDLSGYYWGYEKGGIQSARHRLKNQA